MRDAGPGSLMRPQSMQRMHHADPMWNVNFGHTLRSPSSIECSHFLEMKITCCSDCTFEYIGKLRRIAQHRHTQITLQNRTIFGPKNFTNVPNEVKKENILTGEFVYTISQQHTQLESDARNQRKFNAMNDIFVQRA